MRKLVLEGLLRVVLIVLFIVPFFAPISEVMAVSRATTIRELRQELAALQAERTRMENERQQTQSQINAQNQATFDAYKEIEENQKRTKELEEEIEASEVEIVLVTEETNEILRSQQISSTSNIYFEYILNADSITDLLVRSAIVEQLTRYNQDRINDLNDLIDRNKQLSEELVRKNAELDVKIANWKKSIENLGSRLAQLNEVNEDINSQIRNQNELIRYYVSVCTSEDQLLTDCVSIMASTGWWRPLVAGHISSPWGYRTDPITGRVNSFHNAIDISRNPEGTSIFSPANGMVAAVTLRASCGGNMVYIHHMVNGRAYTSHYAHLLDVNVKVGDRVTVETVIGTVGGGRQTPWDRCSTGPHLHFGIARGHYLGGGPHGYSSWNTFIANSIVPPGYENRIGFTWTRRV